MKLLELYNKYDNSGIDGNPVITMEELEELYGKLKEVGEFVRAVNITELFFINRLAGIEYVVDARKKHLERFSKKPVN